MIKRTGFVLSCSNWPSRYKNISRLPCPPQAGRLTTMFTVAAHITMMMVMEMPSPGHFVMSRDRRGHAETGRLR